MNTTLKRKFVYIKIIFSQKNKMLNKNKSTFYTNINFLALNLHHQSIKNQINHVKTILYPLLRGRQTAS
jgi:hypothetical protein